MGVAAVPAPLTARERVSRVPKAVYRFIMRALYRGLGLRYHYTLDESIAPLCDLYNHTQRTLDIVGGELNPRVFATESFRRGLRRLVEERGAKVRMVSGPQPDPLTLAALSEFLEGDHPKVPLRLLPQRPLVHFSVVDGAHVRVEDPHPPYEEERTGYVSYGAKRLSKKFEEDFEVLRRQAKPYRPKR